MSEFQDYYWVLKEIQSVDRNLGSRLYFEQLAERISKALNFEYVVFHFADCPTTNDGQIEVVWNKDRFLDPAQVGIPWSSIANTKSLFEVGDFSFSKLDFKTFFSIPLKDPRGKTHGMWLLMDSEPKSLSLDIESLINFIGQYIEGILNQQAEIANLTALNSDLEQKLQYKNKILMMSSDFQIKQERVAILGRVVAGVSHELANPLGFIFSGLKGAEEAKKELLEHRDELTSDVDAQTRDDYNFAIEDLSKSLTQIKTHGRRLENISNLILNHSKMNNERLIQFNLGQLIKDNLNFAYHGSELKRTGIKFNSIIEIDKDISELMLTPGVSSLFLNVFTNSFDSIYENIQEHPEKTAEIEVKAYANGRLIEIDIKDNGKGITEDVISHVDEPFFTTKGPLKGTGLGLTIVRSILEQNNGEISFESVPEEFTEVHLHFPRDIAV